VNSSLLDTGYFCISVKFLKLYSGVELNYRFVF
jgi:hypothetical protein